jgi:hypothetical protein
VVVDRSAADGTTEIRAIFARYEGVRGDDVLDLLGQDAPARTLEACGGTGPRGFLDPSASVELIDVGDVSVRLAGASATLVPTTFPDIGSMVAGVHYADATTLPVARPDADEYRVFVEGTGTVPPFDALTVAPLSPEGIRIAGEPIENVPVVLRGEDLVLQWEPIDPRETIEIVVRVEGRTARCRASDDGAFRIPGPVLLGLSPSDEAELRIRRVRYEPFDAPTFDEGWLRLTAGRTATFALR